MAVIRLNGITPNSEIIKPLHGIGNAPLTGTDDGLFHYLGEAGIPFSRLHDTGGNYGGGRYVDIANVFRDFSADPDDPGAYDFAFTDWLMTRLHAQGTQPFYRLGASIENSQHIKAYNIYPPVDNLKWARVCAGIIRHYNEGWANGFHMNVRYWEIWNEPDNMPDISDNPMWKGTKEQYFELYEVAARYLKSEFPQLRMGGYASCGFYALSDADFSEVAKSSTRTGYFIEFMHDFLRYISSPEHRAPLDFFSWHSYAGVRENPEYAAYARNTLDRYGFTDTETFLNEWNPGVQRRGTLEDAAVIARMFCTMQAAPVDGMMYYDGQLINEYCGLFDPETHVPRKAYYAFRLWNELYRLRGGLDCQGESVACCAATNGKDAALLIANGESTQTLRTDWRGAKLTYVLALDDERNAEPLVVRDRAEFEMSPFGVYLIRASAE